MFLFIDIPGIWKCLTTDVAFYTGFDGISIFGTLLNLFFSIFFIPQIQARLPWRNSIAKYNIKKLWRNNPEQIKLRKLILSDTEIIINKTDVYPIFGEETKTHSYSWDKLRRYYESDRGFYLDFPDSYQFFIPRRVFTNQGKINKFKRLLSNSKS